MKLKNAAISFDNLCKKKYKLIVAKKRKEYNIDLLFKRNQFYHLIGIQHLKDINLDYKDKNKFFKDVINNKINMETLSGSSFFVDSRIEDRIEIIQDLEKYLDSDDLKFRKYIPDYSFSKIDADYILIKINDSTYCNIFAKEEKILNFYCLNSCNKNNNFIQHSYPLAVIYKKKINLKTKDAIVFIDNRRVFK
jgi:hypothetical protein